MKALVGLLAWHWQQRAHEQRETGQQSRLAFFSSLFFHLVVLLALALVSPAEQTRERLALLAPPPAEDKPLEVIEEFYFSDRPHQEIGARSSIDATRVALSEAQLIAHVSEVPSPVELLPTDLGRIEIQEAIEVATGLHYNENLAVKGAAGEGTLGAMGAIDRITHEILLSLEQRKTLVVWLFDQSGSLNRQREQVRERFDRVYRELGVVEAAGNPAFKDHDDKPLLTSVIAFGQNVSLLTKQPTDDLEEIVAAVDSITMDVSGVENVFTAFYLAADRYKGYRVPRGADREPERNVLLIAFTDEAGDDQAGLEKTVEICRRYAMPVYIIGVPAPFGRDETLVKWVDPDPNYDQTPQWGRVSQGPETLLPERIKLSYEGQYEAPIDSGFGPYALTRLCYETGGIYFAVHPNRTIYRAVSRQQTADFSAHLQHFFDPEVMRRYRPDYVSANQYKQEVEASPLRTALVRASQMSWITPLEAPRLRFVKRSDADLVNALSEAQKDAARLEPRLNALYSVLKSGEEHRPQEYTPRWQAGFDVALGMVMAAKVRTEGYNAMLALAKRSQAFEDPKNNTWVLEPSSEITVGSQLQSAADKAGSYLERVVDEHPKTPWALLAKQELDQPMGWKWTETFTDLSPPPRPVAAAGNGNPAPPRDDQARQLPKPKPRRDPPKL